MNRALMNLLNSCPSSNHPNIVDCSKLQNVNNYETIGQSADASLNMAKLSKIARNYEGGRELRSRDMIYNTVYLDAATYQLIEKMLQNV